MATATLSATQTIITAGESTEITVTPSENPTFFHWDIIEGTTLTPNSVFQTKTYPTTIISLPSALFVRGIFDREYLFNSKEEFINNNGGTITISCYLEFSDGTSLREEIDIQVVYPIGVDFQLPTNMIGGESLNIQPTFHQLIEDRTPDNSLNFSYIWSSGTTSENFAVTHVTQDSLDSTTFTPPVVSSETIYNIRLDILIIFFYSPPGINIGSIHQSTTGQITVLPPPGTIHHLKYRTTGTEA